MKVKATPVAEHTTNKETTLFLARVEDLAQRCQNTQCPGFMGFLDPAQQTLAGNKLKYSGLGVAFWGGYDGGERVFLGVFPDNTINIELFPLRCLELIWKQDFVLTHRDFLGSFMALQLRRETIGDICVEAGRCVVFTTEHAADLILAALTQVGRVGVTVTEPPPGAATPAQNFLPITGTAASLRLDCVVALLANTSRSGAARLISSGLVSVDGIAVASCDKTITQGNKLSIRGTGKFIFDGQDGVSRKDKLRLRFRKYQ